MDAPVTLAPGRDPVAAGAGVAGLAVLGRGDELARIDAWLSGLAAGSPPLLVLTGEPGIGKTTLWAHAIRRARALGYYVLSSRPAPSYTGLPHVGLADLLRDVPDAAFGELPGPQRRALDVALLRAEPGEGDLDPRAVGTGLTALLAAIAAGERLILAVDDAQWLDPASARSLAFALRRLEGRPVAVLAAIRVEGPASSRAGAFEMVESSVTDSGRQRLEVGPLSVAAVHQMFARALGTSFPRPLLVRIHRAAGGNPFYALEIARELQRGGSPPPGQPLPIPGDHRDLALLRTRRLPKATRELLAAIAANPRASVTGAELEALAPAERAGIAVVRPDGRVEFTHPLFGSALYSALPEARRRRLHRELAGQATGPEERARHLALAADGADEATATELDLAAAVASARGAADVAVELKELACQLTPSSDLRAAIRRRIELADRRYFAGDPTGARRQLERCLDMVPADGDAAADRARILLELGAIRWVQGEAEAGRELMLRALNQARSRELRAQIHTRLASGADDADLALKHGEAALALLDENTDPVRYSFALHTCAMFKLHAGRGADHAAIEKGMRLQREAAGWDMSPVPAFWAKYFDDLATARQRLEDILRRLREQGDEAQVTAALTHLAGVEAMTGHMGRARELADEAVELAGETEQEAYLGIALCAQAQVRAQAGELEQARAAATELLDRLAARPDLVLEAQARAALGQAALAAGNLAEADRELSRADEITELVHNREPANQRFQADHAEAVIELGGLPRAELLVQRLEARAAALPRPWILAVSARSRGLLNAARGDLDAALADYQRALAAHEGLDMPSELGRTLLALGRLHRRRNERQKATANLERAVAVLTSAGAHGWAAIARDDLARARGRRRGTDPERLTATERAVCELAAAGLRNHEIAARMFLSDKTVEANLSRAYRKLGVRSRTELAAAMARADPDPA